jgi:hypothetical protein
VGGNLLFQDGHDTGDVDLWANSCEEFMYFQIVEEVADKNREIHSDDIINTNGKMGAIPWASWSR